MSAISLTNIQKTFGANAPVIRNLNLEIGAHEFCVFLGPSGCGKSTLLRIVAGLEDQTDGDVAIGGRSMNGVPAAERGVAMVFQSYALFPHMSVYENMAFGLKLAKTPKAEVDRKVREAARVLQLDTLLERKPRELSGGQRQRVAIGRAIVREPGVFLFDEPLSNLDAALRGQTRIEIARLHQRFAQASVVYVTHDQIEAMTLADKIVLLHAGADTQRFGSIAQIGAPLELYHRPRSRFVAGFIGSPRMNFLDGEVDAIARDGVHVRLKRSDTTLRVQVDGARLTRGQTVTVGIRPEHIRLDGDAQTLAVKSLITEQLGEHSYVHVECPDGMLIAKAPGDVSIRNGEPLALRMPADACHLFDEEGIALARTVETEAQAVALHMS
ncbi:carbohydrate ABC transporter ATP-binding protein, CUT1 family (TC 3.A.1.1.-) [Paraburkholderia steynii]|uniref:Carbohydrate ABC transporter ATP-binding protein, CUT1 family (TC 3.A.1.1.-) n=1 Tax=Paraburkholderia steynii TaxID=1245441 RepID=A0A7Z7FER6_9BURK|nr:sn-glycerol-3-phosphate ABC transporter ATP-binding protein UgpC [Paraburkholderia steynii]SDH13263.1 carbohydrate ABC transporter ATP-binding protein, CUT1 family (TC 3.A.1.1.-) [Paraburkholderia steynii]